MNFKTRNFNTGKVVYFINGQSFENDKGQRNGRAKAEQYCLDNFLNINDIQKFDSRTERDRYVFLLEQARIGVIDNLGHHFTLKIQDEFVNANGDTIPPITYEADFIYREVHTGKRIVEDVKGSEYFIDERFLTIKQVFDKLMLEKGLYIRVVLYRNKEWVEWHIGDKKKSQKLIKKQREELRLLKQKEHERLMNDNLVEREKKRLTELNDIVVGGGKLTSSQLKRYEELKAKYNFVK